jgi:hypothetical protein
MANDNDPATQKIAYEQELLEQRQLYLQSSGNQPTVDNLLKSLTIQNARGDKGTEVLATLKLITSDKIDLSTIIKEILACYDRNPDNELVQIACADTLVRIDKSKGIDLSRKILANPQMTIDAKLRVARNLVAAKVLIGYPVLREGLITSNDYQRRKIAIPLLAAFSAYDGVVYGEHGEKVDIRTLIADAKKSVKDQRIIDDLEKAELKYSKQPNQ